MTYFKFAFLLSALVFHNAFSQSSMQTVQNPSIGKNCPDFLLNDVVHFLKPTASLKDFRGKWLILDFWTSTCTSCIHSFSKMGSLQVAFKDEIKFILVGKIDNQYNKGSKQLFERLSRKKNLELTAAFDSVLFNNWDIHSVPHIVIIDPKGIVQFITNGHDLTVAKLTDMTHGKVVKLAPKDIDQPEFILADNSESNTSSKSNVPLFSSQLLKWHGENQNGGIEIRRFVADQSRTPQAHATWLTSMVPLYALYNYAYLGSWTWTCADSNYYAKVHPRPILEIRDSSSFQFDYRSDVGNGLYNYALSLPQERLSEHALMQALQSTLSSCFGYQVVVEERLMPVWRLVATAEAVTRLKTKGGVPEDGISMTDGTMKSPAAGFTMKNQSVQRMINVITFLIGEKDLTPFVDDTGILTKIDITIDADLTNFNDIQLALGNYGLEFKKNKKRMTVIVIRDKAN